MLKSALLITSLSLLATCKGLPPFPEVHQCVFKSQYKAFFCVNSDTGARVKVPIDHEWADGMQALPTNDPQQSYQSSEAWVRTVKEIAEKKRTFEENTK